MVWDYTYIVGIFNSDIISYIMRYIYIFAGRPHAPVLEIPDPIVESHTTDIPVCRVSSLGYPPMKLVWLLKGPGGNEKTLQASQLIR